MKGKKKLDKKSAANVKVLRIFLLLLCLLLSLSLFACGGGGGGSDDTGSSGGGGDDTGSSDGGGEPSGTVENYKLMIEPLGQGSVTGDKSGIDCGTDCEESFAKDSTIILTATGTDGYSLLYWSGCDAYSGNSCTVHMDANRSVFPTFGKPVVLQPKLRVLDSSVMAQIVGFDASSITFASSAIVLQTLQIGDIIGGSYNNGFLRKVLSITKTAGGLLLIATEDAKISEAVKEGTIAGTRQLKNSDITNTTFKLNGVSLKKASPDSTEFTFEIDTQLNERVSALGFSDDFEKNYSGLIIKGNASFSIMQDFGLDLCLCWNPIDELRIAAIITNNNHLNVSGTPSSKIDKQILIGSIEFGSYDVSGAGILWLSPILDFYIGFRAEVGGEVTAHITFNQRYHAGVRYTNDHGWSTINNKSKFLDYSLPSLKAYAQVEGYFKPELKILLNGVVGPYINIEPYVGIKGDVQALPVETDYRMHVVWQLYAGLDSHVGVKAELLGEKLGDQSWDLIEPNKEWTLAEGSWDTDKPKASIIYPLDGKTTDPWSVYFGGKGIARQGSSLKYEWDFGDGTKSTEQNIRHTYSSTNSTVQYDITLTLTDDDGAKDTDKVVINIDSQKPTVPENLSAKAWTNEDGVWAVDLNWDASTDNTNGFKYSIYKSVEGDYNYDGDDSSEDQSIYTTWRDFNISTGTKYCYKVKAKDKAGNSSSLSSEACIRPGVDNYFDTKPPTPPQNVIVIPTSDDTIYVFWIGATDNVGIGGYTVYRDGVEYEVFTGFHNYGLVNTGLAAATEYCYQVSTYDKVGNTSVLDDAVCATTLPLPDDTTTPSTPGNVVATAVSTTQINLKWNASTDNIRVAGYRIYRNGSLLKESIFTYIKDIFLTPDTQYCYTVSAYDASNNESGQSTTACATTTPAPDIADPSIPTGLNATLNPASTVTSLTWSASTDNLMVVGYRIYRNGSFLKESIGTSTTDSALSYDTVYCYTVSAYDAAGNESAQSGQDCVDTVIN